MDTFQGKTAIISGGAEGIGPAIAHAVGGAARQLDGAFPLPDFNPVKSP